jgi:hypothetical protein
MYFPWNWEFDSALSKLQNFGGFEPPKPSPLGTPLQQTSMVTPSLEVVFHGERAVFYTEEFCSLILSHGCYMQWNSFSLALGNMALPTIWHLRKLVPRQSSIVHNLRRLY